ncbi:MAG: hypothetical protein AAF213_02305 [Pseudomonadota bacterium]
MNDLVNKADAEDNLSRFREIISDPLNLLIDRVEDAGVVKDGLVTLHNGVRVPADGDAAYYSDFSAILQINRGVHEPLEEFVFQEVLRSLPEQPRMIELGAYWAHYSMWLQQKRPQAHNIMVEFHPPFVEVGKRNFALNGFDGEFINQAVAPDGWLVDPFMKERGYDRIDLLHADIQGAEVRMLASGIQSIEAKKIDRFMIATHSANLHMFVAGALAKEGYRVEVDCHPDTGSYASDGFVYATAPHVEPIFDGLELMDRQSLLTSGPRDVMASLNTALHYYQG